MPDKPYCILIAEDFEENRTALTLMLKFSGFSPLEASNGLEAKQLILSERPDLVLMDISLPEMDGIQVTREIRQDAQFQDLPIIIVSGYDSQETRDKAAAAGVTEFICKPVDFDELKRLIEKLLIK